MRTLSYSVLAYNATFHLLCDCYREFKHRLLLEPYLQKLKGKLRVQLSQFRCAPYTSPRETKNHHSQKYPFCCEQCKADEYHVIMLGEYFKDSRVELLPDFSYLYPIMVKFDNLMDSVNIELLKKNFPPYAVLFEKLIHPVIAIYHLLCCL